MARTKTNDGEGDSGAVESLEQAFHLLRQLSAREWLPAAAGSLPFVLTLIWACSHLTSAGVPPEAASTCAGLLVGAFVWLTVWQAVFARRLWAALHGDDAAVPPWRDCLRPAAALLGLTALSPWLVTAGLFFPIGLGWAVGYFRHVSVLAFTRQWPDRKVGRRLAGAAFALANHRVLDYHLALLLSGLIGLAAWVNVAIVLALLPTLVQWFSGVESAFTLRPAAAFLNGIFVLTTFGVTWALMNPLLTALFVLRSFQQLSRTDGSDLLVRLRPLRQAVVPTGALAVVLMLVLTPARAVAEPGAGGVSSAGPRPTAGESADAEEFRGALRRTLDQPEYRWRMPLEGGKKGAVRRNGFVQFIENTTEAVGEFLREVDRTISRWKRRIFGGGPSMPTSGMAGSLSSASALSGLVYVLLGAAVCVLVWLIVRFIKGRQPKPAVAVETAGGPVAPDLNSEATLASQLPEDEWLALARQQMAAGDYRLAIRAIFLASLARLGEQDLIGIARAKSNRDYQQELGYRARSQHDMQAAFAEAIGIFEYTWYGWHEAGLPLVERLEHTHARLKLPRAAATPPLHAAA